jgi:hypothetical protein
MACFVGVADSVTKDNIWINVDLVTYMQPKATVNQTAIHFAGGAMLTVNGDPHRLAEALAHAKTAD